MKNTTLILSCFCLTLLSCSPSHGQLNKVMTYNIRYDNPKDGINKWDSRKEAVVDLFKHYEPEVFGVQEALHRQLEFIDSNLPHYSRIGVGRDDGKEKGEYTAIYYDKNKLSVLSEATFWLSEDSERVSKGWDAALPRICTYGLFESKVSQEKFLVFNAHYDHKGMVAREKSSELIVEKINEINTNGYPVILMGDFNAEPESQAIRTYKNNLVDPATQTTNGIYGPTGTFTGFEPNTLAERRIDYIFVQSLNVVRYQHVDDKRKNNGYISDHLPVLIEIK